MRSQCQAPSPRVPVPPLSARGFALRMAKRTTRDHEHPPVHREPPRSDKAVCLFRVRNLAEAAEVCSRGVGSGGAASTIRCEVERRRQSFVTAADGTTRGGVCCA
jgi:hypothetical protein